MITRGVANSGFRLFGRIRIRIRIALVAEHFDAAPAVLIFTTSLCPSLITAVPTAYMLSSHDPMSERSWHGLSEVGHRRH